MEMLPQVGIQSERYTAHAGELTLVVEGVIGWLTLFPGFLERYERGVLCERIEGAPATDALPQVVSGFYGESAHFIRCLLEKRQPSPDLASALRSVEIAEAVNQGRSATFQHAASLH
jgi:predicted dehydrogenase